MARDLVDKIESSRDQIVETLSELIRIKALSPENGGDGELDKAEYLTGLLEGFVVERYDAEDERAREGIRPNIVARIEGEEPKTVWIISHLDVVPEGDLSLWDTDPFEPEVKDGRIYGRGSEDNGHAVVASLFAARAINELGLKPKYSLGLAFVADEEVGSKYGIQHLLKQDVFHKDDLIVVPDAGSPQGDQIEIAEKSILWLKFSTYGKQGHASRPEGKNAARKAMNFLLALDTHLHEEFGHSNPLFKIPTSTFEPTKRKKNVDNVNTIPGLDISYMDCRIIPDHDPTDIIKYVNQLKEEYGSIEVDVLQNESSPPTSEDSEVVARLSEAVKKVKGINPVKVGFGGNTCGAFFRKAGFQTAVWSTIDGTAHQPNEYTVIDNIVEDARVFAVLPFM
ncbi:MAG: M20 family metallo-hydrolase [Archaeoglobaceae archaeon]